MRTERHFILARGTATLMVGAFLLTNVVGVHGAEKAFWVERRGAAHRVKPGASLSRDGQSENSLLAQLPGGLPASAIGTEVIAPLNSFGPTNPCPALRSSLPPGDMKKWGWLPELVAPYGDIREIHLSSQPDAPLIVHLQDVHEVEEAQRNLAGLVGTLHANRGISLVGLEGAVGAFDLEPYRSSATPELTRGLADAFMKLGYLTGPEAAGIVANKTPTLWGIEDLPLYRDHIAAFQTSEKARSHVQRKVAALSAAADGAREKIYSAELRAMDDHRLAYLAHREPLVDYVSALFHSFKGNPKSFLNAGLLLEALKWERSLDFKEVERERLRLVEVLVQRLSPDLLDALVQDSLRSREGRLAYGVYLGHLRSLCRDNGIALEAFGSLNSYISYRLLAERIDPNGLLQEMDDLEKTVLMSLAQTVAQRRLVTARRDLSLLEKLVLHSLTPAEWKTYQTERGGILDLQNTLANLSGRAVSESAIITAETVAPFEMFSARAMDRNGALVKNMLNKMRTDQTTAAVFVAGGFHTEGVTRILREEGVSYAVVTPRMTKVPDNIRPLDVFARAPLPLEKLLAGDVIHLAYAHLTEARHRAGAVSAASDGVVRRDTLHLGWVAIRNAFESELSKNPDSPIISAFQGLTHLSKKPLAFQGALFGFLFKATVEGIEKQFKVVMARKNNANSLFVKNGFTGTPSAQIELTIGTQTYEVRIFKAEGNDGVEWVKARSRRLGRYLARSVAALDKLEKSAICPVFPKGNPAGRNRSGFEKRLGIIGVFLLFCMSFGMINVTRADNEQEAAIVLSEEHKPDPSAGGLISVGSDPNAERQLIESVKSSLLDLQSGRNVHDGVFNIAGSLKKAMTLNPELAGELAQSVLTSTLPDPWLNSFAELVWLKSGGRSDDHDKALQKLLSVAHGVYAQQPEGRGVRDDDVWPLVLDVFKVLQTDVSFEQKTAGLIDLHSLAAQQLSEHSLPLYLVLLLNRIENDWLSEAYAKALVSDPQTPEWLRSIANKKKAQMEEAQEEESPSVALSGPVFDYLKNINSPPIQKAILWEKVKDWSREVLLGTTGTLKSRVFHLSPLEAYVLLDVMSRQDPTIRLDTTTALHVRAQLWVIILSGLKSEFDRGPSPPDTSIYGPLSNLVMHGEGFGQKAFFDYAVQSGHLRALTDITPNSLRHLLSVRIRGYRSPGAWVTGLLPLIGRPVFLFLSNRGLTHRLAAGIAGLAEQGVISIIVIMVSGVIGFGTGWALVWLVPATLVLWTLFPKLHGDTVLVYRKSVAILNRGYLEVADMTEDHRRALRRASHVFFGMFLAISLVPYILPLFGIPFPVSSEQWMFGGALVSSLSHGSTNSFFPFSGKAEALGRWGNDDIAELLPKVALSRSLLGGPVEGRLDLWEYSAEIEKVRLLVENDRTHLAAQREALMRTFFLNSKASVFDLVQSAARSHALTHLGQEKEFQESVRSQIKILLALAYEQGQGNPERANAEVVEAVRLYHEAQNLMDDERALMAAIETGKEMALELTPPMLEENAKSVSPREEAQWRRLKFLSRAVSEGKLKKQVRLIVPDGVTAKEVETVLKNRNLSLRDFFLTKPKSSFRMEDGKYSVNKFVSWLTEDHGRSFDSGSIDMYLMNRSEWEWDNLIEKIRTNIRLLEDVLPGLVIDATNRLPNDLKRIVAINVTA